MSFSTLADNCHDLLRKMAGFPASAQILFLKKTPSAGFAVAGAITSGFFIEQEKPGARTPENLVWLRFPNTPANIIIFNDSTNFVPQNYHPLFDNLIFDLNKKFFVPGSLSYIKQLVNPTAKKYTP